MMNRILAVAANTRKEAFRNRAFLILVLLGLGLNASGVALSKLALSSQQTKVIQDFGYFAVSIVSVITAILMGIILLYKELDRKTIYALVPKPVMRFEIVLGKFVGLVTLIVGMVGILGLFWLLFMWWVDALVVVGRTVTDDAICSLALIGLEAMLITSVALLFSSWTRPFLSGLFTFGYFLLGRWIYLVKEHLQTETSAIAKSPLLRTIGETLTYVVPDLQTFNVSRELALGIEIHWGYVGAASIYAASFSAIFLVIAVFLFSRRDFV